MRASKQDQQLATTLGQPASTVVRHRTNGLWPADGMDLPGHYEMLAEIAPQGRDGAVVALEAAARYGRPLVRLRDDLKAACPVIPDGATMGEESASFNLVQTFLTRVATGSSAVRSEELLLATEWDDNQNTTKLRERPEDVATGMVEDAIKGVAQAIGGEASSTDFVGFSEGLVEPLARTVPDPEAVETEVKEIVASMVAWRKWVTTATTEELVSGVQMADQVVGLLEATTPGVLTETARWQFVAQCAPWLGSERSTLQPIVTAISEQVKKSRPQSPLPTPETEDHRSM